MAQVSYGTITITDTNDIERIYMEYAQSSSNSVAPASGWSEDIPAWEQGKYIWQRTVVKKEGVALSSDSYGDPVCLTGSTGSTGSTGRGVSSIVTKYCNYGTGTPAENYSGWGDTVPSYDSTKPNYWVKTVITYTTGTPATETKIYQDNGITSATATAASAKTQAAAAEGKADDAVSTANTANTNATNALNIATGINQHFWTIATDYATGVPAGSYITDTAIDTFKSNKTGGNLLTRSDGIWIRNGVNTLTSLTGTALTFYNPTDNKAQLVIGANGTLQSGNYVRGTNAKFSDSGTKIDLTYGDIITKYFRLSQGVESLSAGAYIYGTIEAIDGKIGSNNTNYWEIGNYTDYLLQPSAKLIGHGSSFIQLGNSGTWRLATNRIHTGWYESGDSYLHFPTFTNGTTNRRWDYGIHVPTSKDDKFLYIRNASSTTDLNNLISDLEDTQSPKVWEYQFYIDGSGNVHAPGFYIGDSTTPIGGGAGTVAERLTQGYGSATQPIYFNSNGVPTNTTYQLNAAGAKGVDTSISAASTSTNLPTSQAVAAFVEGKGYSTTDNKVQTSQANTTKIYLAGTSTAGTSTGTLNFDSNVYLTTTAGTLHATTFEGNLSGTASRATADSDGNTIKTTYLKLTGGNVTGVVTFGSSVSVDELTVGDLVVNGSASFTNNLQANTINGVAVGSNPKFTDNNTTYTFSNGTNGFTVTPSGGTAQTVTVTPSISNNITGTGTRTSGYLAKFSDTNTITNGPALGTGTTKFLREDGTWVVPGGTYSLPIASSSTLGGVKVGSGLSISDGVLSHTDTSSQASSSNSGRTYIQSITLDTYGHVTALSTATETVTNTHNTAYLYAGASNGTANAATTNGNTYLILMDGGNATTRRKVSGSGTVSVASDASGNITITGSAHPTSLKNPNALTVKVYNGTSTSSDTSYDGSTSGQSVSVAGTSAITGITASAASGGSTTFTLTKANGGTSTFDVTVTASVATGATTLTDASGATISEGSATKPVYFSSGVPVEANTYAGGTAVTLNNSSKASSTASFYAPTTGGTTSQVLIGNGTTSAPVWTSISSLVPSSATNATNDSDGNPINTTYIKKSIGTAAGDIIYWSAASTPTRLAKGSNGQVLKLANGVPTWGTDNNDNTTYSLSGALSSHKFTTTLTPSSGSATTSAFTLAAGSNISLTDSGTTITIAATDTNTATAVDNILDGSNSGTAITYAPYTARADKLMFYTGTTAPNGTTRLNLNGYLYATKLFSNGSEVLTSHQDISGKIDTAGTGLSKSGTTLNHSNSVTAQTTQAVYPIKIDAQGHISGYGSAQTILSLGTGSSNAYRGDYGNTAYTHATDSGRLTTAKSSSFYKFSVTAHGHVGSVTAVAASDITGLLNFGTAYNASSNKIATISDVTSAISGATDKYVTLDTDQTLVANGTKKYLGLQTYGSNGVAFGVTSSSSITQKVVTKYDSTLDALVFQFS